MKFFLTSLILHISLLGGLYARPLLNPSETTWILADVSYEPTTSQKPITKPHAPQLKKSKVTTVQSADLNSEQQKPTALIQSTEPLLLGSDENLSNTGLNSPQAYLIGLIMKKRIYPFESLRLRQQGKVRVSFQINEQGHVVDIRIQEPCSHHLLNQAALQTLNQVKLNPEQPQTTELVNKSYSFIFDYTIKTQNKS